MQTSVLLLVAAMAGGAFAHIRLLDPPARSTLWRFPEEFGQYNPEPNYSDDELWCANIKQFEFDTQCGICGDPVDKPMPRDNERGGRYGRDIISRTYKAGDNIPIHAELYAPHGGYLQIQLCKSGGLETEDCFEPLILSNGQTNWPMRLGDGDFNIITTAQLPAGVTCDLCTLRLHYRGAQHWGTCDNSASCECDPNSGTPPGGMGCGLQQTFRTCSDIVIN